MDIKSTESNFLQNSFQSFNYPDSNLEQFFLIEESGYSSRITTKENKKSFPLHFERILWLHQYVSKILYEF